MARFCQRCHDADISNRDVTARYCFGCAAMKVVDSGGLAAHKAVKTAIQRGDIPPAKTLACTDCAKPAHHYDHRDYGKPLEVQPVCRSCNRKRGPARPVLTFELPDAAPASDSSLSVGTAHRPITPDSPPFGLCQKAQPEGATRHYPEVA